MSLLAATSLGVMPTAAPREARSATGAGFKSNTVMGNPARARFSAMGFPILPRPINPIRSIVPNLLNYTAIFQIGERIGIQIQ